MTKKTNAMISLLIILETILRVFDMSDAEFMDKVTYCHQLLDDLEKLIKSMSLRLEDNWPSHIPKHYSFNCSGKIVVQ